MRELREQRRLTGRAAATYLEISGAHVSDMESGKSLPSLDLLIRLVGFYRTTSDYLLGLTDDPNPFAGVAFAGLDHATVAALQSLIDELRPLTPTQRQRVLAATKTIRDLYEPNIIGGRGEDQSEEPNQASE